MADNTTLDPGAAGDVIATDDVTGVHFQKVKIADGTADSAAMIGGDATNGLDVDVTRLPALPAGTNNIGDVDVLTLPAIPAGTNNIGDVDVLTVPVDPFGANADAAVVAGAAGSIQAKLRRLSADLDSVKTAVEVLDNAIAGSEMQVDVVTLPALPAGTNNIGDVDVLTLPAIPAGTNNIGDVDVLTIAAGTNAIGNVGIVPRTSGGLLASANLIDIDETEDEIKATAGQVFGWYFYNDGATEAYVKFYDATAATVVVGTTTPAFTLGIPAGGAANAFSDVGIEFATAITIAATTIITVADTTAPAANQVSGVVFYK